MNSELYSSFVLFAAIGAATPGPNNLLSASLGTQSSYRQSTSFLMGIASGVTLMFMAAGFGLGVLLQSFQGFYQTIKYLGVLYLIWMAALPLLRPKSSQAQNTHASLHYNFGTGILLQLVNPKLLVNGVLTYSLFGELLGKSALAVVLSALFLGAVCYGCISIWHLLGKLLRTKFSNPRFAFGFNLVLFLLMLYIAIQVLWLD